MTTSEYIFFAHGFFGRCIETSKKKTHDYTKGAGDDNPFANLRACEAYGIPGEQGVFVRMLDKMSRISSFLKKGELQVSDESITDTLEDLANYAALLAGMLAENRLKVEQEAKREGIERTLIDEPDNIENCSKNVGGMTDGAKGYSALLARKQLQEEQTLADGAKGYSGPVGNPGISGTTFDKKINQLHEDVAKKLHQELVDDLYDSHPNISIT
jgi:hypothetical protein